MMFRLALLVSAVTVLWRIAECKSGVIVTAPKVWLLDSEEKVCVTSVGIPSPLTVMAELRIADYGPTNGTFLAQVDTILNSSVECFVFPLTSRPVKTFSGRTMDFKVEITNTATGYRFSDNHKVGVQRQGLLTFIQTDKPVYKPGQTVKFRILSVMPDLLPNLEMIEAVYIEDPKGARMMQWTDVNVKKSQGLADFEMPLSPEPVQGQWKVTAQVASKKEEHAFKVEEYVLPKYEIVINPPSYIMTTADDVSVEVCAKYTYGEPVKGLMLVEACALRGYSSRHPTCVSQIKQIDGCASLTFNTSKLDIIESFYNSKIQFRANVTENGTGVILTSKVAISKIERTRFKLDFNPFSPSYFKPGITYHGKVIVKKPDGTPAAGEVVQIDMDNHASDLHYSQNFTSNSRGEIEFGLPLPVKSTDVEALHIQASMPQYISEDKEENWRWRPYPARAFHRVKQWYSPSGSHVQIAPIEGSAACGAELKVNISYTTSDNNAREFHYQVISGGDIVYSDMGLHTYTGNIVTRPVATTTSASATVTSTTTNHTPVEPGAMGPEISVDREYVVHPYWESPKGTPAPPPKGTVATFIHTIPVTSAMSGEAKLLVFYVLPDGEVVADSRQFTVTECVKNDVKLEFLHTQKYPGDKTKLRLQADPGSLCSVGVVDKSVQLMGQDTQLTLRKVFDLLKEYDITEYGGPWTPDTYCRDKMADEQGGAKPPSPPSGPGLPMPIPMGPPGPPGRPVPRQKRSYRPGGGYYSNYVDSKKAFEQAGVLVIGDVTMETRPCQRRMYERYHYMVSEIRPAGMDMGMFFMGDMLVENRPCRLRAYPQFDLYENAPGLQGMPGMPGPMPSSVDSVISTDDGSQGNSVDSPKKVELRNYFPETWLWDLYKVRSDGEITLNKELPHTITEWVGNAFCSNSRTGLGVSPSTKIRAFQPFFVSFTLPYSVIRGEKINLPVTVFNYLTECLVVELVLKGTDGIRISRDDRRAELCVCGQQSVTHRFKVMASDLGEVNVTAKASSIQNNGVCGNGLSMSTDIGARDAVTRQLLVEPEGREQEKSFGSYLCPQDEAVITEDARLSLPEDVVEDSARAFINIIGDVMGPSLSDLDKLLRLPTGCGEQNMLKFAPNIFVMQYLTATNQLNGEIKDKAIGFLTTGYQRELSYRHDDGSYSAFGKRDPEGSMWLTAFVVKSFSQARPYIYIDDKDLNVSIAWFKEKQLENGCFPQVGKVLHKAMKGGLSDGGSMASLTAYVLVAMLEAGISRQDPAVVNAIRCLDIQTVADDDMYTSSLLAYAYSVYDVNDGRYAEMIDRLWEKAINLDGTTHWEVPRPPPPTQNPDGWTYIHHTSPADVEATAYALMAIAKDNDDLINEAMPVVRWLTAQRNPQGGFGSTQDTVVGLQALATFAINIYGDDLDLSVRVAGEDGNHVFIVDNQNSLILQQVMVAAPNHLRYTISGKGCVFVQTNLRYNVHNVTRPGEREAFDLRITPKRVDDNNCRQRKLNVCVKYAGPDGVSNMAVVAVKMVSGWIPDSESVHMLMQDTTLMLKRFEIEKNIVNFYFDELISEFRCFTFQVNQDLVVDGAKPGFVHVYDYYETSLSAMTQYKIRPYCGTKEEIPFDYSESDNGEQRRVPVEFPDFINSDEENEGEEEGVCPNCVSVAPQESVLLQYICQANHAYKSYIRRGSQRPLRVIADLRTAEKLNFQVKYTLPDDCECEILQQPSSTRVLVFTKETEIVQSTRRQSHGNLQLDGSSIVVPLSTTDLERKLRRHVKRGRCQGNP